jgi:hypothetical protein
VVGQGCVEGICPEVTRVSIGPDERDAPAEACEKCQGMVVRQEAETGIKISRDFSDDSEVAQQVAGAFLLDEERLRPRTTDQTPLEVPSISKDEFGINTYLEEGTAPVFRDSGSSGESVTCDEKSDSHGRASVLR